MEADPMTYNVVEWHQALDSYHVELLELVWCDLTETPVTLVFQGGAARQLVRCTAHQSGGGALRRRGLLGWQPVVAGDRLDNSRCLFIDGDTRHFGSSFCMTVDLCSGPYLRPVDYVLTEVIGRVRNLWPCFSERLRRL